MLIMDFSVSSDVLGKCMYVPELVYCRFLAQFSSSFDADNSEFLKESLETRVPNT
jgi:hypothetical protein